MIHVSEGTLRLSAGAFWEFVNTRAFDPERSEPAPGPYTGGWIDVRAQEIVLERADAGDGARGRAIVDLVDLWLWLREVAPSAAQECFYGVPGLEGGELVVSFSAFEGVDPGQWRRGQCALNEWDTVSERVALERRSDGAARPGLRVSG